jgi:hypothetical protein
MTITKDTKHNAGSCTFCARTNYTKVYVLQAEGNGSAKVRICKACWKEMKAKI